MTSILLFRKFRQIIPNSNLAFIRQYVDKTDRIQDLQAIASHILQKNHQDSDSKMENTPEDSKVDIQQLIVEFPEEPTTCCMSGCANCVWLDYAEKISAYYKDGGEKAIKEINEKVADANVKAFLLHEIRMRQKTS